MSGGHDYPHESTGVETRKLGMWVFLSTEILFFGTLITTFMIFKGRDFPGMKLTDVYDIPFTSVSSFVLLMSSLTMVLAHNALENEDQAPEAPEDEVTEQTEPVVPENVNEPVVNEPVVNEVPMTNEMKEDKSLHMHFCINGKCLTGNELRKLNELYDKKCTN